MSADGVMVSTPDRKSGDPGSSPGSGDDSFHSIEALCFLTLLMRRDTLKASVKPNREPNCLGCST